MLTASYMTPAYLFREEFILDFHVDGRSTDAAIQPIDAPECISMGSHHRVKSYSGGSEYGLPNGLLRQE